MYSVLRAEEQLSQITTARFSMISMEESDNKKIVRELEKQASRKEKPKESMTIKLMQLASMGITVVDTRKNKT